ncbi:MAG: thiol reductant ABC exporter subunit CydD [Microbacteriaceae bacterium]|nr:thiol reductant ABC exporter subunit CydD [Microbacteriaceae bacterium]
MSVSERTDNSQRQLPVDPKLFRYASTAKSTFVIGAILGFLQGLATVVFAGSLAYLVFESIAARPWQPNFILAMFIFGSVSVLRMILFWLQEYLAIRGAAKVKSQLRKNLVEAFITLGPSYLSNSHLASLTAITGKGLDALDNYFGKFLPQLLLTVMATPVVVISMFYLDWISGITVLLTMPLIPIFMVLIGLVTQTVQKKQWDQLKLLSNSFLDTISGLVTLKIFRREHKQAQRLDLVERLYRQRTLKVLRVSFISGFVLELAASLSVALIAVSIGIRMIEGDLGLFVGLFVLVLAPEAYLPLRNVGTQFHASTEGVEASRDAIKILESAQNLRPVSNTATLEALFERNLGSEFVFSVKDLNAGHNQNSYLFKGLSFDFLPRSLNLVSGSSGSGKSSLFSVILGFLPASSGKFLVNHHEVSPADIRGLIAWAGQDAKLFYGTVAENITVFAPTENINTKHLQRAMELACLGPQQNIFADSMIEPNGGGLSGGQLQRVALARAFYRFLNLNCQILLLDEPSSALDKQTESFIIDSLQQLAAEGATIIVASHRDAFLRSAEAVLDIAAFSSVDVPNAKSREKL